MTSHITLSKKIEMTPDNRHTLKVWVSETTNNIPEGLFIYQRIPSVPLDDAFGDHFVHVASYADIGDAPPLCPGTDSPFYRLHHVYLIFDSLARLQAEWEKLRTMVGHTIEDISRLNEFGPIEIVEIPL